MYLTRDELLAFMPKRTAIELTCDDAYAMPDEPNPCILDEVLNSASELIDGYLRGRYTLPLTGATPAVSSSVPTILRDLARVIARYRLYERRPESGIPDAVTDTYKAAVKTLEQIRHGHISLGIAATAAPVPETGEHRIHSRPVFLSDSMLKAYKDS